jgi:hypothetical protein
LPAGLRTIDGYMKKWSVGLIIARRRRKKKKKKKSSEKLQFFFNLKKYNSWMPNHFLLIYFSIRSFDGRWR